MTQHRNTLNGIASEKIAANAVTSALLRDQVAFHVEFSGDRDIHNGYRVTNYVVRSVPGMNCPNCGRNTLYCVYSYLTLIYSECPITSGGCGHASGDTHFYSKTTRNLQYLIAGAYPHYATSLEQEIAREQQEKKEDRNARRRKH